MSVLFVYNRPTLSWEIGEASNVDENIAAFARHSRNRVWSVNTDLYWSTTWGRAYDPPLGDLDFGAIVIHYSVFGAGPQPYLLGDELLDFMRRSKAYKVAFFQDEFHWAPKRFKFIDEYGIDCVYTMLEQPYADQVYGEYTNASRVVSHLPGYVGPELIKGAERFAKPDAKRSIDIGYRGRASQAYWGRTGRDKERIAEFAERAAGSGLALDIATAEEKRIYGERWHRWLADCKATLGTESGVSCFDPTGEVLEQYVAAAQGGSEPTYEQLEGGALGRWDEKIPYRTIGPRNFEAAAMRVCQILFPGSYSGLMEPMVHYIPLDRDFSNLDQVIERFGDEKSARRADRERAPRPDRLGRQRLRALRRGLRRRARRGRGRAALGRAREGDQRRSAPRPPRAGAALVHDPDGLPRLRAQLALARDPGRADAVPDAARAGSAVERQPWLSATGSGRSGSRSGGRATGPRKAGAAAAGGWRRAVDRLAPGRRVDRYWTRHLVTKERFETPEESESQLEWRFEEYPMFREFSGLWGEHEGETVLDYGCGPGNDLTGLLVHSGAGKVIGVDVSSSALELARERIELHGIDPARFELLQVTDAEPGIPLPDASVDYLQCQGVLQHTSDPLAILGELARVLKPGGTGRIMAYNRESLWLHLYTAYVVQIVEGRYPELSAEDAFSRVVDGPEVPIARCWSGEAFVELCERAGFEAEFLGGYLSRHELDQLPHRDAAIAEQRLAPEHREFLSEVELDAQGLPIWRGRYAGVGGSYVVRPGSQRG